jgi:DNA processing protein
MARGIDKIAHKSALKLKNPTIAVFGCGLEYTHPPESGALITAQFALEQGREVFAVPGNIYSSESRGTHALLKMGAKLADSPEAIVEKLSDTVMELLKERQIKTQESIPLNPKEEHLMSLMSVQEQHIDQVIENSYLSPAEV